MDHEDAPATDSRRGDARSALYGEIFICVEEAVRQARRFRTLWQAELVRYLVHGLLHLTGHDDRTRRQRQAMKHEEERLLSTLKRRFPVRRVGRRGRPVRSRPGRS